MGVKTSHWTRVEAVVGAVLPQLSPICVWCCDTEKGEESDSQGELNADENIEWPFIRAMSS